MVTPGAQAAMRVAVVDDSALFRRGLAALLKEAGVQVTALAATADEILIRVAEDPPDVAILDVRLPPTFSDEGLSAAERIRAQHPQVGVLLLSTYAVAAYAARLLNGGSTGVGYLLKDRVSDVETLYDALVRVAAGESVVDPEIVARLLARERGTSELDSLSDRERQVLALMAEGRSNLAICERLYLSPRTVESHVARLFEKLDLPKDAEDNRRVLAVLQWLRAAAAER
jgi:DNA-binding NarL/FixJ family response regulator